MFVLELLYLVFVRCFSCQTKEAVDQARHCLEYLKVSQPIPQAFAGRMIGKGGSKMQEIVDQAAVVRASTELVNSKGDVR